jgi:hypothetical protein
MADSGFIYLYDMQGFMQQKWRAASAFVILFVFFGCPSKAAVYLYNWSDNCSKAYQYELSMHFAEANTFLAVEQRTNPNNLMSTYIADYEDCITLVLTCDKSDYERRIDHFDTRMELLDKGDMTSPWYRLCKAGVYLHWGIVNMRFGEEIKAALKFRKAFALLRENEDLFPAFEYDNIFSGLREAVIGSLPGSYKWLASVFGIRGNLKKGAEQLAVFVNTHTYSQPLKAEGVLYYSLVRFYLLSQQKETWDFLNSPQFVTANNLLNTFLKANIGLDNRKYRAVSEMLRASEPTTGYKNCPIFQYQMGLALLPDSSSTFYFTQYLKANRGDLYVKDCWQKMAYAWYINGNMPKAEYCMQQIKLHGSTRIDADKQAEKFADNGVWPNRQLLHARLLIDGGYYNEAMAILSALDNARLTNPVDKAEYFFRLGRVYEEQANNNKALEYYQATINTGKQRHEQFAARAALRMGIIYEHTGQTKEAIDRYNECLDMPSHDFQNSIDNQAKAGLNRIEGR